MASVTRKVLTRLLIYLVRRDSPITKPYFRFLSLVYRKYSRFNLARFGALSDNDENVIFEHFKSRSVGVYPPRHGKLPSKSSHAEIECPPVRAYLFRENKIHVNSSCALNTREKIIHGDFKIESKGSNYASASLLAHGLEFGLIIRTKIIGDIPKGIFMGGNGSSNYYHFLIEILPKLDALLHLKGHESFPLLVNEKVSQIDTFSQIMKLYAPNHELIFLKEDQSYQVEQLVCISSGSYLPFNLSAGIRFQARDFITRPESIAFLRRIALPAMDTIEMAPPPRIFLARKQTLRSYNQEEVHAALEPLGFVCVYPEDLSFLEQVKLFNSADYIVGPSGAAWSNLAFASSDTKALCWMAEEYGGFAAFSTLAGIVGVDLNYHIYSTGLKSTAALYSHNYQLDPLIILEAARAMLKKSPRDSSRQTQGHMYFPSELRINHASVFF